MNLCDLLQTMKLDRDGAVLSKHGVSIPRSTPPDRILTANSEKEHHGGRHYRSHLYAKRGRRSHGGGSDVPSSRYFPTYGRSSERTCPFL